MCLWLPLPNEQILPDKHYYIDNQCCFRRCCFDFAGVSRSGTARVVSGEYDTPKESCGGPFKMLLNIHEHIRGDHEHTC